tara:strand:+ start:55 stop:534 length:480 start_codon:yes stop_codon:yes gene_type:complete
MEKNWLVATYKTNEVKRLERNLINQKFNFYLPKITIKNTNSSIKEQVLFPGYIFVNISIENYSALKYTRGISNIIKFGEHVSYLTNDEINKIRSIEKSSKSKPVISKIRVGQEALVSKGSFKGMVVKICSLPSKKRVDVFLYFLGSKRRTSISEKDLIF